MFSSYYRRNKADEIFNEIKVLVKEIEQEQEQIKKIRSRKIRKIIPSNNFNSIRNILERVSNIYVILGMRGSGKSTLAFAIGEYLYSEGRRVYTVGFPTDTPISIDINMDLIEQVPDESVIIFDEAGIQLNSKASFNQKSKYIANVLKIARHKGLSFIFITQNSASITPDVMRLTDTMLLLKPSLLQSKNDRPYIRKLYKEIEEDFKKKSKYGNAYVLDQEIEKWITFNPPSFWNEKISRAYR